MKLKTIKKTDFKAFEGNVFMKSALEHGIQIQLYKHISIKELIYPEIFLHSFFSFKPIIEWNSKKYQNKANTRFARTGNNGITD